MTNNADEVLEQILSELRSANFLCADSTLDACGEAAQQWIVERLDEHLAALSPFLSKGDELPSIAVQLERSMKTAAEQALFLHGERLDVPKPSLLSRLGVSLANIARFGGAPHPKNDPLGWWLYALRAAWDQLRLRTTTRTSEGALLYRTLKAASSNRWEAHTRFKGGRWSELYAHWKGSEPWFTAFLGHAFWMLEHKTTNLTASPWEPLLRIWQRGGWPLITMTGTLCVYVPLRNGNELLADPANPWVSMPEYFGGEFEALLPNPWNADPLDGPGFAPPPASVNYHYRPIPQDPQRIPGGPQHPPEHPDDR